MCNQSNTDKQQYYRAVATDRSSFLLSTLDSATLENQVGTFSSVALASLYSTQHENISPFLSTENIITSTKFSLDSDSYAKPSSTNQSLTKYASDVLKWPLWNLLYICATTWLFLLHHQQAQSRERVSKAIFQNTVGVVSSAADFAATHNHNIR